MTKTTQRSRNEGKAKRLSEEALEIAEERRAGQGTEERKRYSQMNAEFQRLARRGKKVFLNEQCKEVEENNRMGKIRDLFRKIVDIKGTFYPQMTTIKDRKSRYLVDAEEIKKRWKEHMEELYKKDLNVLDYCDGVVSHPEPDILESEVK